jgi:4-carboxymuconolactone decarboxylase
MARISQITTKNAVAPDKHAIFDAITASRGSLRGPFPTLLHSPEIAGRAAHLGAYIRYESTLSQVERELAIITTTREFDCQYAWTAHARMAREAGVREEAIDVIGNRGSLDALTEDEALIVRFGRELYRDHRISDATFQAAHARFGDQGVVELTATMGYYGMLACTLNAFEVEHDLGTPRLP